MDHKTDKLSYSGIYKLKCEYIQGRKFKQRYQEYRHSFIYNNPNRYKFAAHLLDKYHPLNPSCFSVIKTLSDKKLINTWEQFEIYKTHKSE